MIVVFPDHTHLLFLLGLCVRLLFWFAALCVLSSFEINPLENRKLFDLLVLGSQCHVAAIILCTFIKATSAGLKYVIVALYDHTHIL